MSKTAILLVFVAASPAFADVNEEAARDSIESALKFVDTGGAKIESGATCINCHHSAIRSWSLREAARIGSKVDVDRLSKKTNDDVAKLIEIGDGYRSKEWDHSVSAFFVLGDDRADESAMSDEQLDSLAAAIVGTQGEDGSWKAAGQFRGQRRPTKDAGQAQTMWNVLALTRLESREGTTAAREKALVWLQETKPGTTIDSRVLRILIEQEFGSAEKVQALLAELLAGQHDDGGWGWQRDDRSDAWATGMTLYMLSRLEAEIPDAVTTKALEFLTQTQKDDGSWHVDGKLKKSPKMASYFGTVWAIIGISRTLSTSLLVAESGS